ncbi:hypothetical protein HDU93_009466 [Gonapodya sp. JEL0774]|nr:hypothetical protein HDU93_009466 [Gonapodya sp. JEL0774]
MVEEIMRQTAMKFEFGNMSEVGLQTMTSAKIKEEGDSSPPAIEQITTLQAKEDKEQLLNESKDETSESIGNSYNPVNSNTDDFEDDLPKASEEPKVVVNKPKFEPVTEVAAVETVQAASLPPLPTHRSRPKRDDEKDQTATIKSEATSEIKEDRISGFFNSVMADASTVWVQDHAPGRSAGSLLRPGDGHKKERSDEDLVAREDLDLARAALWDLDQSFPMKPGKEAVTEESKVTRYYKYDSGRREGGGPRVRPKSFVIIDKGFRLPKPIERPAPMAEMSEGSDTTPSPSSSAPTGAEEPTSPSESSNIKGGMQIKLEPNETILEIGTRPALPSRKEKTNKAGTSPKPATKVRISNETDDSPKIHVSPKGKKGKGKETAPAPPIIDSEAEYSASTLTAQGNEGTFFGSILRVQFLNGTPRELCPGDFWIGAVFESCKREFFTQRISVVDQFGVNVFEELQARNVEGIRFETHSDEEKAYFRIYSAPTDIQTLTTMCNVDLPPPRVNTDHLSLAGLDDTPYGSLKRGNTIGGGPGARSGARRARVLSAFVEESVGKLAISGVVGRRGHGADHRYSAHPEVMLRREGVPITETELSIMEWKQFPGTFFHASAPFASRVRLEVPVGGEGRSGFKGWIDSIRGKKTERRKIVQEVPVRGEVMLEGIYVPGDLGDDPPQNLKDLLEILSSYIDTSYAYHPEITDLSDVPIWVQRIVAERQACA